jgi:CheY-like chemotaxis protein/chemotaxis protein CheY-P-specific phosphatase CheC
MAEFPKLRKLINHALKQSCEESSMLLGQELSVQDADFLVTNKLSIFGDMDDPCFVVGVESREDYPGCLHMVFALRDAIAMSGILLGIPPARISEKKKLLILEADDIDAFSEIANQIIGSFNSVFQPALPHKVHLKQLPPTKFIPHTDEVTEEKPVPEGDYLLCRSVIELQGQDMNRIDILIPIALAELMDPEKAVEASGPVEVEKSEEAGAKDVRGDETLQQGVPVLILEDNATERQHVRELLEETGYSPVTAALNADIDVLVAEKAIKVVVLGITGGNEREFAICTRINSVCEKYSLPIIMSAGQWTRTGVLKAVKNGARDILIKPYSAEELIGKLGKFLNAA